MRLTHLRVPFRCRVGSDRGGPVFFCPGPFKRGAQGSEALLPEMQEGGMATTAGCRTGEGGPGGGCGGNDQEVIGGSNIITLLRGRAQDGGDAAADGKGTGDRHFG